MKEYKCRFLDEYANFKKRYYKTHAKDDLYFNREYAEEAVIKLDNIVRNAHKGMITLDEAMMAISEV